MATEASVQQRNLESSLLFMQQEHANTLKGLHEEIRKLQKKCSDLTFQMAIHGLNSADELESKVKRLESELSTAKRNEQLLRQGLERKEKDARKLEVFISSMENVHTQEMKAKDCRMNELKAELEAKCSKIAYLTTELHKLKIKQKMEHDSAVRSKESTNVVVPAPPKDAPPVKRRPVFPSSKRIRTPTAEIELNKPLVRVGSGRGTPSKAVSADEPNDPASFLQDITRQVKVETKPAPAVLPPIRKSSGEDKLKHVYVKNVVRPQCFSSPPNGAGASKVETLAVDPVTRTERVWSRQSKSSEYN